MGDTTKEGSEALEKARELLETNKRLRLETCRRDLMELLKKHGCRLEPQVVIQDGRVHVCGVQVILAS